MMKTISKYTLVLLATMLFSMGMFAQQDKEVRIKILKKHNGKTEVIDTIIQIPGDSVMAFWASPDMEKMQRKTDSVMEVFHKRMEKINMDSMMREVESKMKNVEIHMDINLDSIIKESTKSLRMLDSMDFNIHLPNLENLDESIREGMKEARFFIMDEDFEEHDNESEDIQYIDGKVIKIKSDRNGKINKAIIMSPDGENVEVKEGMDAYRFVTDEGEEIIIVTNIELKDIDKSERKELTKKGIVKKNENQKLEAADLKIFPNPNEGNFRLSFRLEDKSSPFIKIFDQSGNIVYSEQVKNFRGKYDKEIALNDDIKKGIYFLQIIQNAKSVTKKMLVD